MGKDLHRGGHPSLVKEQIFKLWDTCWSVVLRSFDSSTRVDQRRLLISSTLPRLPSYIFEFMETLRRLLISSTLVWPRTMSMSTSTRGEIETLADQQYSCLEPKSSPTKHQYKEFAARWSSPPHLAPPMPVASGKKEVYYYSPYGGWNSNLTPVMFRTPGEAMCWGLSRFKRDGLSNSFGPNNYPSFVKYVFIASFRVGAATDMPMPSHCASRPSEIESAYFETAQFFQVDIETELLSSSYLLSSERYFQSCCETMKATPDWMCSSHSIYKRGSNCLVGGEDEFVHKHDTRLSSHRTRFKFVQLENNFLAFKFLSRENRQIGKNIYFRWQEIYYSILLTTLFIVPTRSRHTYCQVGKLCSGSQLAATRYLCLLGAMRDRDARIRLVSVPRPR